MKLEKLNFAPKVLRKEAMVAVMGGGSYCYTGTSTTGSGKTAKTDWTDGERD